MLTLADLKIGQTGRIINLNIMTKEIKRHLLDLGLTCGTLVTIKKIAPMGDPIDIYLRGYELCLRKKDLKEIEINLVD